MYRVNYLVIALLLGGVLWLLASCGASSSWPGLGWDYQDMDGDGIRNGIDPDIDGDGWSNENDIYPLNAYYY